MSTKFNQFIFAFSLVVCFLVLHCIFKTLSLILTLLISIIPAAFLLIGIDAIVWHQKEKKAKEK